MRIKNLKEYFSEKNKFDLDPEKFWAEKAEKFSWHQKWNEILNWDFYKAKVNWFSGGKLNITENCLDRHLKENEIKLPLNGLLIIRKKRILISLIKIFI